MDASEALAAELRELLGGEAVSSEFAAREKASIDRMPHQWFVADVPERTVAAAPCADPHNLVNAGRLATETMSTGSRA